MNTRFTRSLRARLLTILALLVGAALASAIVMLALFQQSTAAQIGQASALASRGCGAIAQMYRFYTVGWNRAPPDLADPAIRRDLTAVVFTALHDREDVEGGLWHTDVGPFAYAFPTAEDGASRTDVPSTDRSRVIAAAHAAQADDRLQLLRFDGRSQTVLVSACPLSGPVPDLTAWTVTRVHHFGGTTSWQLLGGLGALLFAVGAASAMVTALLTSWSRHVRRMEVALASPGGDLPQLPLTGERELDRIVNTVNEAGRRLRASRLEAERLGKAVAEGERFAAVGRVAAGVAHAIRSPIAAMRLKAELAVHRVADRKDDALRLVIEQVDRLDLLVARMLAVCEREPLHPEPVDVPAFLANCAAVFAAEAERRGTAIAITAAPLVARFDRQRMERAVGCLVANALQLDEPGPVGLDAAVGEHGLTLAVTDHGPGPPPEIQHHIFEAFVSGRAQGAGLGLAIVREVAEAHGGTADMGRHDGTTTFRITLPWPQS